MLERKQYETYKMYVCFQNLMTESLFPWKFLLFFLEHFLNEELTRRLSDEMVEYVELYRLQVKKKEKFQKIKRLPGMKIDISNFVKLRNEIEIEIEGV